MSKKLDDLDMEVIQELAKSSQKVQDLIQEKNETINRIEQSQNIKFKKFDPAPKPKGDIRINKLHSKETMSKEEMDRLLESTKNSYESKIKVALEERAIEVDKETLHPLVEAVEKEDICVLLEDGKEAFKDKLEQKELEESLKLDMETIDNKYNDYPIYFDFEINTKDLENKSSPADGFE